MLQLELKSNDIWVLAINGSICHLDPADHYKNPN